MNKRVIDKEETKPYESTIVVAGEVQEKGRNVWQRKGPGAFTQMRHATLHFSHKMRHFIFSESEDENCYFQFPKNTRVETACKVHQENEVFCVKSISELGSDWIVAAVAQDLSAGKG